jgi:hypothetical protein
MPRQGSHAPISFEPATNQLLASAREPPIGAHIVTPRSVYTHHGIYEHFCEWCLRGEPRSYQVEELTTRCSRAWFGLVKLLYRALFVQLSLRQRSVNSSSIHGEML